MTLILILAALAWVGVVTVIAAAVHHATSGTYPAPSATDREEASRAA